MELAEVVWRRLEVLLPHGHRKGRPYGHERQVVLRAIVYVMESGCGWRGLPAEFPPWQTVHWQLGQWKEAGIWDKLWTGLPEPGTAR